MSKETLKLKKAVKKLAKAVRKALDKGASQSVVENTIEKAMAKTAKKASATEVIGTTDDDPGTEEMTAKAAKVPGRNKPTDLTFKRGLAASSKQKGAGKAILNTKPLQPDRESPSPKKLPGKRKPPTPTLGTHNG